ncbi:MAG: UDP-N-acetylmuramoyl-L-alanyl-D-glutamate--2,6-diaminopimelate ligase [Gammaproteobacteria bacterium]|nr:UDP-N-acetylmuramoyl-L-alanyl-D-glutamate--2,6-diaminopimelate ligase [Gammaproteobacteria bacterium]
MKLSCLFADMDLDVPDVAVTDITSNSHNARSGGLFLACAGGARHGLEFLSQALEAGIRAVAWEPVEDMDEPLLPPGVIGIRVTGLRASLGLIADRFFSSPSADVVVTGITGTNGKTTTAYLVAQAMNQLDMTTGYMGTLGYGIGTDLQSSSLTTPDCITLHRRLRALADAGAQCVIAEVSSHALDQQRVAGVHFQIAALTNLSRDHLDYHDSMQNYAETKARLFAGNGIHTAVLNVGNPFGAEMAGRLESGPKLISVAVMDTADDAPDAQLRGLIVGEHADGIGLQLSGDFGEALLESTLWGRFNAENLAMAVGILLANGVAFPAAIAALKEAVAPPGRMELVRSGTISPTVVVDFAHTPDALGKALETARQHTSGKVWCVFGCGGNRDQGKRGSMGAVAAKLADRMIITDDNPRDEDPQQIAAQIIAGVKSAEHCEIVHDRETAIETAISSAAAEDVVLVAGKGHELVQLIGNVAEPFSDVAVARTALGGME